MSNIHEGANATPAGQEVELAYERAYFERGFIAAYAWSATKLPSSQITDAVIDRAWDHRDEGMDAEDMLPVQQSAAAPILVGYDGFAWCSPVNGRLPHLPDGMVYGWRTKGGHIYMGDGYPVPARRFALDPENCDAVLTCAYPPARIATPSVATPADNAGVRDGWKLVKVDPDTAMQNAARDWSREKYGKPIGHDAAAGCWTAMLAASPKAPSVAIDSADWPTDGTCRLCGSAPRSPKTGLCASCTDDQAPSVAIKPVAWVSPGQLAAHNPGPDDNRYLPVVKQREGNFTMPLYAAPSVAIGAGEGMSALDAWQELSEYTDRTSPAEYPDMCLITFDELRMFMCAAAPNGCICGEVAGENADCPLHAAIRDADAEVTRIMSLTDDEMLAEATASDVAWARGFKLGLTAGQSAALTPPSASTVAIGAGEVETAAISLIVDLCGVVASQSATNVRVAEDHLRQFARDLTPASASIPADVEREALHWLADCDNLILFNGVEPDGWWEVRRASVKGEVRGRGPTPLDALRAAMLTARPSPVEREARGMVFADADRMQRFHVGDVVSHNGGLIEAHTKRTVTHVLGYDPNGGVQYRLALPNGSDRGLAYDVELDAWPEDEAALPARSPRINWSKP